MSKLSLIECDVVYLSYDEPNAEKNYADLLTKAPWAKRVHGVKGSDAAHKACAAVSETERFITVDGDNIVNREFFNQTIEFDSDLTEDCVVSWASYNVINGLIYGNGGLKCWTRSIVNSMRTHEHAADPRSEVDFCWDIKYRQVNKCYSETHNNATPYQAWRAGFREGVKMSLDRGIRFNTSNIEQVLHWRNLQRLLVWTSVGADAENGQFAIYGARLGAAMTLCSDWDFRQVRDFDYLKTLYESTGCNESNVEILAKQQKDVLRHHTDLNIVDLDPFTSRWAKQIYNNPSRTNLTVNLVE
jgi:hypothetical protein